MSVYPTINLPRLIRPSARQEKISSSGLSPSFDFLTGEFLLSGGKPQLVSGQEAFEQWCLKVVMTERNTRLAYSDRIGVEFERIAKMNDPNAIKSRIARTITEAIMIHPRALWVKDFTFSGTADHLYVSFLVRSDYGLSKLTAEV